MSATFKITITCNGCNREIATTDGRATKADFGAAMLVLAWDARCKGMMDNRRAWKKTEHYCRKCADGAPKSPNAKVSDRADEDGRP